MDGTRIFQYQLTVKWGTKLIKGLKAVAYKSTANTEETLLKENEGVPFEEMLDFDVDISISGETWQPGSSESSTLESFESLREAIGDSVSFVYGNMATGGKIVTGTATLKDWSEDAGSDKKAATWSGTLKATRGTVAFSTTSVT